MKSTLSTHFIKSIVSKNYDLGEINDVILIKSDTNDIYKILFESNIYILKIYSCLKKKDDLEEEIEFKNFLKSNNFFVPCTLKSTKGKSIISINYPEGTRFAELSNFINGCEFKYKNKDTNEAYLYGKKVGGLHLLSKHFKQSKSLKKFDLHGTLYESKKTIEEFVNKYYVKHLQFFQNFIDSLFNLVNLDNLSKAYCHNDLHGGNAAICDDDIAFFDFEFSGYGYILYEIAVFKWACMIGNRNSVFNDYIKGYESIMKIDCYEKKFILYFVAIRDIFVMSLYIKKVNLMGHSIVNNLYIESRMNFLKDINQKLSIEGAIK